MLAKANRLTGTDFRHFPRGSRGVSGTYMRLIPVSGDSPKMGIIASGKHFSSSVQRSLLRRRVYEIGRHAEWFLGGRLWVLVILKSPAAQASYGELQEEFSRLAAKISSSCSTPPSLV